MKGWLFPRFPPTLGHHMLIRIIFLLEKNNIKLFVSERFTISVRVKLSFPESRKILLFQALSCKVYVKQLFYYLASPKLIWLIFESLSSDFSVIPPTSFNLIYGFIVIWCICYICILGNAWKGASRWIKVWLLFRVLGKTLGQGMERSFKMNNSLTFAKGLGEMTLNWMMNEGWDFD